MTKQVQERPLSFVSIFEHSTFEFDSRIRASSFGFSFVLLWFQVVPPNSIDFTISGPILADDAEPIPTIRADLVRRLQEKYGDRVLRVDSRGRDRTVTVRLH
jgi:hypothetical protein